MKQVWLGLGGNIGDVSANMALALNILCEDGETGVVAVSSQYRTPPWGKTDQPWFINACAQVQTNHEPTALMARCLDVEARLKRERVVHWGPRSMDIDILVYERVMIESQRLTIPHPRMLERGFVMLPLNEIAPDLVVFGAPVNQWLKEVDVKGVEVSKLPAEWYVAANP